jgi:hypothetical protein
MARIVLGLMKDPHQARGLVRALKDEGFAPEEVDVSGGYVKGLTAMGVPIEEAHSYAEGVRRGGMLVAVRADDESEAELAAERMLEHGAVDLEACTTGWRAQGWSGRIAEPHTAIAIEHYTLEFGEYPAGTGRHYRDPRTRPSPSVRTPGAKPGGPYNGPERRVRDQPYVGINRRAA